MDRNRVLPFVFVAAIGVSSMYLSDIEARLNTDILHWGLIFSSAQDLVLGRTPFRETYEIYGLLSSVLNAAGFLALGSTLVSLGHITSFFYASNLVLSYLVGRRFLHPWVAVFVPLFMFLLHPYVIFPWPNYPSYTFYLGTVYFLLRTGRHSLLIAGILFTASILTRHTMALSIAPPVVSFLVLRWWQQKTAPDSSRESVFRFVIGAALPAVTFLAFLVFSDLVGEWARQVFAINSTLLRSVEGQRRYGSIFEFARPFVSKMYLGQDGSMRAMFLALMAWCATGYVIKDVVTLIRRGRPTRAEIDSLLVGSSALFGFFQGAHFFNIFRVVNAASLGIILVVRMAEALCGALFAPGRRSAIAGLTLGAFVLSTNLLDNPGIANWKTFTASSPWPDDFRDRTSGPYRGSVRLLHGKAWPGPMIAYVERSQSVLRSAKACGSSTLINTSVDPLLPYLVEDVAKAQREAGRIKRRGSDLIFPDEVRLREELLTREDAILATGSPAEVPENYEVLARVGAASFAVPRGCLGPEGGF